MGVFLKNNGHFATERELLAIIRRIDTDGDAKLSYTEFTDFLNGGAQIIKEADESYKSRSYSLERTTRDYA